MTREYTFSVNGFAVTAQYDDRTVAELFLPLLRRWTDMRRSRGGRILVFLSAPPGVGKTTTAQFLEYLSQTAQGVEPLQAVGLDGFHYHADYIAAHTVTVDGVTVPMKQVKGAPETFDAEKLIRTLIRLRERDVTWPVYDRNLHDVIEDAIEVRAGIVLVEGNWLLYNEGIWATLVDMCDDSVFIEAQAEHLRERLIARKMRGGLSYEDARDYCDRVDCANVWRLMAHHHTPRECWVMGEDGTYQKELKGEHSICVGIK